MSDYYFDERAATVAERFFDRLLVHIEGPLAGEPFVLEPWQRKIVREVFGWKLADGRRRYRKLYCELPRGNGKSTWSAGLALLLLAVDGERSAKVYSAAADKMQAGIVFETAEKMVEASPFLKKRIKSYRNKTMEYKETGSKYIVLSSDAYTKHGLNPHGIVFDELHAQPNRELYDVLNTAMGKRRQPLMIMITTAGYDRNSICWEQHEYARQVAAGIVDDPTFYPAVWAADESDDWTSPETWQKANPNYGVSVREEFLRQECIAALASPSYQNTFRRLYLNQWCVTIGTMIAMSDGTYKRAEDVRSGDMIVSFDEVSGSLVNRRVRAVFDNGQHVIYRVTTKRGRVVETTSNHPFWSRGGRPDSPKYKWVNAAELAVGDRIGVALDWPDVPNSSGLTVRQAQFLGVMLGDGAMTDNSPRITTIDPGILEFCRSMADEFRVDLRPRGDHPAQWRFHKKVRGGRSKNPLKAWLEAQGVYWTNTYNKRIPASVWQGGREVWAAFLGGYLDTDGSVFIQGRDTGVIWISANRGLLEDSQQMLAMLGIQSNLKAGRTSGFLSWRLEVHERRSVELCAKLLPLVHSQKKGKLNGADTTRGPRRGGNVSIDRFRFDPIASIDVLPAQATIGIEIEDTHTHITNGLITHNTQQESRFLDMRQWDACAAPLPDLRGRVCYGGLDLATTTDIAALMLVFPPLEEGEPFWWLPRFWIPADNMIERVRRDKVQYDAWVRDGHVVATEGNVIDYGVIERDIKQLGELYNIQEVAFDRWGATQISQNLAAAGIEMVQMGQGFASMSAPTKELERLVLARQLGHGGHPVLRWMADNVAVVQDPAGNVKPSKAKSTQKIDGIVAGIMAQSRATVHGAAQKASVYEERGIRVL